MTPQEAVRIAVKAAGGAVVVGREFGISGQAVSQWSIAPANRAKRLAEMSGGAVTDLQLRPDIFGPPDGGESSSSDSNDGSQRVAA